MLTFCCGCCCGGRVTPEILFCVGVRWAVRVAHPVNGCSSKRSSTKAKQPVTRLASRVLELVVHFVVCGVLVPCVLLIALTAMKVWGFFLTHGRGAGSRSRASETRTTGCLKVADVGGGCLKGMGKARKKFLLFFFLGYRRPWEWRGEVFLPVPVRSAAVVFVPLNKVGINRSSLGCGRCCRSANCLTSMALASCSCRKISTLTGSECVLCSCSCEGQRTVDVKSLVPGISVTTGTKKLVLCVISSGG